MFNRTAWVSLAIIAGLCLVALALEFWYVLVIAPGSTATSSILDITPYIPQQLVQAKLAGNDAAAVAQYQAIIADPSKVSEEKALATVNIANVRFHLTGDISYTLQDIQNLKNVVADKTVTLRTRATAISILATMYNNSGRNPQVFTELYKDAPFSAYLVPGNPELSAINLAKWSYSLRPTSLAAIYIAQIYAAQALEVSGMSATTTTSYVGLAEANLKKAETLVNQEAAANPSYVASDRYLTFRTWHAITVGYLAVEKGGAYESEYRQEFNDYFVYMQSQQSSHSADELLFTRFHFAQTLGEDKDVQTEKAQLDIIAKNLGNLANPKGNSFVAFLNNEHTYRPTGFKWRTILNMFTISSDFKSAVGKLVSAAEQ